MRFKAVTKKVWIFSKSEDLKEYEEMGSQMLEA